jgi:hypothetical protein
MLLSAIAYNLKRLLKHQLKQTARVAIALCPPQQGRCNEHFSTWLTSPMLLRVCFLAKRTPSQSSATATVVTYLLARQKDTASARLPKRFAAHPCAKKAVTNPYP